MTNKGLTYSKDKTKPPLGSIPVCDVLGAERLGEDSFHSKLVSFTVRVQRKSVLQFAMASCELACSITQESFCEQD